MNRDAELMTLATQCQQSYQTAGINAKTNMFSKLFRQPFQTAQAMEQLFQLDQDQAAQLMNGVIAERFCDFDQRQSSNQHPDIPLLNFFLSQGYKRGLVWRDIPLGKTCYDVNIYQQLMQELKPQTIIELGTGLGASSLMFRDMGSVTGTDVQVITLDIDVANVKPEVLSTEGIEFIAGDVQYIAQLLNADKLAQLPRPWLIIEDCHQHVPLIVQYLYPFMHDGDYLVIEDKISVEGFALVRQALQGVPAGGLKIDTHYTDMFGRNVTCAPDAIFRAFKTS